MSHWLFKKKNGGGVQRKVWTGWGGETNTDVLYKNLSLDVSFNPNVLFTF